MEGLSEEEKDLELKVRARDFERDVMGGDLQSAEEMTLAEFAPIYWRDYGEDNLRGGTKASYRSKIKNWIIPELGHLKISEIRVRHLKAFEATMRDPNARKVKFYTPAPNLQMKLKEMRFDTWKKIGVTPRTFSKLRKGEKVRPDIAERVCKYCNISMKTGFKLVKKKPLSPKTIKECLTIVSSMLTRAVDWELIEENYANKMVKPKVPKVEVASYDDEKIEELLYLLFSTSVPLKYLAAIVLVLDTGFRESEVAGLTWSMINFATRQIEIFEQRPYIPGEGVVEHQPPKTPSGIRGITISEFAFSLLEEYKKWVEKQKEIMGDKWIESDYIFVHATGRPIHPRRYNSYFTEFLKKNKMPHITFHGLRHTNASMMIADDFDPVTVAARLGHSDKSVTLNTYAHLFKKKEKQVASNLDRRYAAYLKKTNNIEEGNNSTPVQEQYGKVVDLRNESPPPEEEKGKVIRVNFR